MLGKYWAVPNRIASMEIPPLYPVGKENALRFHMDENFFYLVGRWLGDGWLRDSQRSGRPAGQTWGVVVICESTDKADRLFAAVQNVVEHVTVEYTRTCVKAK